MLLALKFWPLWGKPLDLVKGKAISQTHYVLRELRAFRSALITDRTRILSRQKTQTLPITRRQSKARLAQIDIQIIEIDTEIERQIQPNGVMGRSMEILRSIPWYRRGLCCYYLD